MRPEYRTACGKPQHRAAPVAADGRSYRTRCLPAARHFVGAALGRDPAQHRALHDAPQRGAACGKPQRRDGNHYLGGNA